VSSTKSVIVSARHLRNIAAWWRVRRHGATRDARARSERPPPSAPIQRSAVRSSSRGWEARSRACENGWVPLRRLATTAQ
jgi:hypothetical protein